MDNPEKLAVYSTQDKEKQNKNTTQYLLVTTIRKQTQITRHEPSYKRLILIGYYTVLCTIWKDIARVCIVLRRRVQYGFSIQYRRVQYLSILYISLYNDLFIIQLK